MSELDSIADSLRRGETRVLDELWKRFGPELRRRARTRLRQMGIAGQTESMDVCNALMVDLAKPGAIRLNQPGDVIHYLMRGIDNQVRDTYRQLSRQRRDFRRTESVPIEEHPLRAMRTSPSQHLLRAETFAKVRDQLGTGSAEILDLVLKNYNWQEIGAQLNIAPDTARMRYRRAVRDVRTAWMATQEGGDASA